MQRCFAEFVHCRHVGPGVKHLVDDRQSIIVCSYNVQRGRAIECPCPHVSSSRKQNLNQWTFVFPRGPMQRRPAVRVPRMQIRPGFQQSLDYDWVAAEAGCPVERRGIEGIPIGTCIHIGSGCNQQSDIFCRGRLGQG